MVYYIQSHVAAINCCSLRSLSFLFSLFKLIQFTVEPYRVKFPVLLKEQLYLWLNAVKYKF